MGEEIGREHSERTARAADRGRGNCGLQVPGADPAAQGARRERARDPDRGRAAIRDAALGFEPDGRQGLYRPLQPDRRGGDGAYPIVPQRGPSGGRAGHRRYPGAHGAWQRERHRNDRSAGHRQAGHGRAGDECQDVVT